MYTSLRAIKISSRIIRKFHTSVTHRVKEIRETVEGNALVIEGVEVESDRSGQMLELSGPPESCCLCRLNLDLQHTDVLILHQFVSNNSDVLPKTVTGLCDKQHKLVSSLVDQAKKAGLISVQREQTDIQKGWEKFNRYFVPEPSGTKTKRYK